MFNELRDLDFRDIGSAPSSVRYVILGFLLVIIIAIGYFLLIKTKTEQLEIVQKKEIGLRIEFENKQEKAANLEEYEVQLAEMQELLETMFRQLPQQDRDGQIVGGCLTDSPGRGNRCSVVPAQRRNSP